VLSVVFVSDDPFGGPVANTVPARALGFGISYCLDTTQAEGFASALGVRPKGVTLTELEGARRSWKSEIGSDLYTEPFSDGFVCSVETVIEAQDNSWGLMTTSEDFAILGGSEPVVRDIVASLPEFSRSAVVAGLSEWRQTFARARSGDSAWVTELVRHLYGLAEAEQLLLEAGW